ncbi:MAG: hypothetical protein U9P07_09675 [Pseudomonadota bacterium]|nr:hypothetical protein [Pseudomonadota bacterium]
MALAHSCRPSMACLCVPHADRPASEASAERITSCDSFGGQYRLPVGRQAMSQARTSHDVSPAMQVRKLRYNLLISLIFCNYSAGLSLPAGDRFYFFFFGDRMIFTEQYRSLIDFSTISK